MEKKQKSNLHWHNRRIATVFRKVHGVQLMLWMQEERLGVQHIFERVQGGSFSSGDGDNFRGRAEIRRLCCFHSLRFSPPSLKKGFGSSATPIKFAKRVRERSLCVPAPCQSSGWNQTGPSGSALGCKKAPAEPVQEGGAEKKEKARSNTTGARLFLNRERRGPAFCHFTSHNTTFTQPNSLCGAGLSQNTSARTPCVCVCVCVAFFFSFFLGTARHRRAEHNDIFRDRLWLSKTQCVRQMSWPAIT